MENNGLFTDSFGRVWTRADVRNRLRAVGADQCEILFVHTDLLFGQPDRALGRRDYLQALYQAFLDLKVNTLVFPAFSYSFANHEDYDVRRSRTSMGALIEHIRRQPEARRSLDPLTSLLAVGERTDLVAGGPGSHSFGPDSGFDRLHRAGDVKFLFFGAEFADSFTYIHYIKKVLEVPYRFDMSFTGNITDGEGRTFRHTHAIHTQCGGVTLKSLIPFKRGLAEAGLLKTERLGDGELACVSEKDIFRAVTEGIQRDPFLFVEPYTDRDLSHCYTFGKEGERVTHC